MQVRALLLSFALGALAAGCQAANPAYRIEADGGPIDTRPGTSDAAVLDLRADRVATADRPADRPAQASDARSPRIECPTSDPTLALCLRFERNTTDESQYAQAINTWGTTFVPGQDGYALSHTLSSRVRFTRTGAVAQRTITLEAWVRLRSYPMRSDRATVLDGPGQYSMFIFPDGSVRCAMGAELIAQAVVPLGVWTAVACTHDGATTTIWADGVLKAKIGAAPIGPGFAGETSIGSNLTSPTDPEVDVLDGLIDNVRIWARARTQAELCASAVNCR